MTASLLALCAALSYSVSHLCVRLGSRSVLPLTGVVLSLGSSAAVLALALLVRGDVQLDPVGVAIFAVGGLLGPGLGRVLSITAISRIGATRASPVKSASQPIVTVLLGVFVLSEALSLTRVAGILLTLVGVLLVIRSGHRSATAVHASTSGSSAAVTASDTDIENRVGVGSQGESPTETGAPAVPAIADNLRVLIWPLAAGAAFAFGDLFRKQAMQLMADAVVGGLIGVSVGLCVWTTVLLVRGQGPTLARGIRSQDSKWFLASGLSSGAAQIFILSALRDGDLSQVGPILSMQPILIALIARVFIQRLEHVGLAVVAAAVLAGGGTILISL